MSAAPALHAAAMTPATRCIVCGESRRRVVCTAGEVRGQLEFVRAFHRRRLTRRARGALADRADFRHDYCTDILACDRCGLVYRAVRPRADTAVAEYAGDRYGAERLQALFAAQLEHFRGRIGRVERRLGGAARPVVVEIGSFVGGFLTAAEEWGWRAIGLDPGEEVVAFCRARGLEVHRLVAEDAPIAPESADCVAIWNTFDQLPDPRPTLLAARRWLRSGGLLIVRVPNGACFDHVMRLWPRLRWRAPLRAALTWNNLLGFPYLYGYAPPTLDALVAPAGCVPLGIDPDTLVRLADDSTAAWAAWEERLVKGLWRLAFLRAPHLAPWLDAYYRAE